MLTFISTMMCCQCFGQKELSWKNDPNGCNGFRLNHVDSVIDFLHENKETVDLIFLSERLGIPDYPLRSFYMKNVKDLDSTYVIELKYNFQCFCKSNIREDCIYASKLIVIIYFDKAKLIEAVKLSY